MSPRHLAYRRIRQTALAGGGCSAVYFYMQS